MHGETTSPRAQACTRRHRLCLPRPYRLADSRLVQPDCESNLTRYRGISPVRSENLILSGMAHAIEAGHATLREPRSKRQGALRLFGSRQSFFRQSSPHGGIRAPVASASGCIQCFNPIARAAIRRGARRLLTNTAVIFESRTYWSLPEASAGTATSTAYQPLFSKTSWPR